MVFQGLQSTKLPITQGAFKSAAVECVGGRVDSLAGAGSPSGDMLGDEAVGVLGADDLVERIAVELLGAGAGTSL